MFVKYKKKKKELNTTISNTCLCDSCSNSGVNCTNSGSCLCNTCDKMIEGVCQNPKADKYGEIVNMNVAMYYRV